MDSWLLRAARTRADAEAVNGITYAELADRALRFDLGEAGPGTRVGIALENGTDFAVALHATWLRGAIAVPHDLRLTPAERPAADLVISSADPAAGSATNPTLDAAHGLGDVAVVLQTSGTSGAPKEVALTFGNLLWSALGSAVALGVDRDDRWLSALPPSHVGGLSVIVRSAIYGTACHLLPRWDTAAVQDALRTATLVSLVPTTLRRLLTAGVPAPRLRWALVGGAPLPHGVEEESTYPIAPTYGLTEAASQVTTFGVPLFCTQVSLESDGEIVVSGPTVPGGAVRTGDLGEWREGRLHVTGRKADTIITGGENVAPAEVEAVLESHPAIDQAAVLGVPDPEWGQRVVALVVGEEVDGRRLAAHARERLAGFKVPKEFRWVKVLPRTRSGKLRRSELGWVDGSAD